MAISFVIFEIKRDTDGQNRDLFIPPCIPRPRWGPRRNIAVPFGIEKLECCGYPMVKKFDDMFTRFDTISACDRWTDGQTSCDNIVRAMHIIDR